MVMGRYSLGDGDDDDPLGIRVMFPERQHSEKKTPDELKSKYNRRFRS